MIWEFFELTCYSAEHYGEEGDEKNLISLESTLYLKQLSHTSINSFVIYIVKFTMSKFAVAILIFLWFGIRKKTFQKIQMLHLRIAWGVTLRQLHKSSRGRNQISIFLKSFDVIVTCSQIKNKCLVIHFCITHCF